MKRTLAIILFFCALLPALAERGPRVTVNYDRADLTYVCKQLGTRMGCYVYVSHEVSGQVTLNVHNVSAEGALAMVLKLQPSKYAYKLVGNTLVVASPEKLASIPDNLFTQHK